MAATIVDVADVTAVIGAAGFVKLNDTATGLVLYGKFPFNMLRTPSIIRQEMKNHGILLTGDKPGQWGKIKELVNKIESDIGIAA